MSHKKQTGVFFCVLLIAAGVLAGSGVAGSRGSEVPYFRRAYTDMRRLYAKIEKSESKFLFSKKGYLKTVQWSHWGNRWDEQLVEIKEDLHQYAQEYPLLFDYFCVALRNLHLLYLEYDRAFCEGATPIHRIEERKEACTESLAELEQELVFVEKKHLPFGGR